MSQYKGNNTSFKPRYAVNGETKTPINVVSTSMEINGQMVEGYQATYANGTSKWTPHVLTDTWPTDDHGTDNSTFTGSYDESTKEWKWEPTSDANVEKLAKHHRGGDDKKGRITAEQIEDRFYDREGITEQQKLSEVQTKALIEEKGGIEELQKDEKFAELPGLKEGEDRTQTSANGENQTDFEASGQLTTADGQSIIESTQTRTQYGNYYYPFDMKSNKQDRVIFKMSQSTGQIIDPVGDIQAVQAGTATVGSRTTKRKTKTVEGSVTLPITSGIKDSNMVDWGKATMSPLQAFKAAATMNIAASAKEGEDVGEAVGKEIKKGQAAIQDKDVQSALAVMIAGKAAQTQGLLSRASGAVANPNLELLFNGPGLRAFDFTFQMSPRDANEAAEVRSIINFFKQGMSVKTTSTNVFLKAPNYFEIDYISFDDQGKQMEHPSLNIIKTCALLTCSVDYTPNNSYMTYSDAGRSMVSYTMNLQFGELDPIYESDYYTELGMQNSTSQSTRIGY